ncbi:MAG: PilT/PilU family type 4a pilus ATPase [Lachnospiraceae bacterium]|nr:PilT/PilU family type 4a pilus ATPase [Lachnospiraceae bacterium]MCR5768934.1 PilT/PilU family type 4a pilus ATPase [Lachnospiraceae bacterium]
MNSLDEMLKGAVAKKASDIFFVVGQPICYKIGGQIVRDHDLEYDWDRGLSAGTCQQWIQQLYDTATRDMSHFVNSNDDDFAVSIPGAGRFRVNVFKQRGTISAVLRAVPFGLPPFETMGIPNSILNIAQLKKGLVLVTGTAGSGKSTTLAYIIDKINHERECHILTLEDPIEYLHRHDKSIISQREIAIDTESYSSALRAALREAPDVILIGEMRDRETIEIALTAAETGHLVLSTLHTLGAANTVDRIVDIFPASQQQQIRVQLSMILKTIVSQQLIPKQAGGVVPAFEIMHANSAIRTLIREGKTHQFDSLINQAGREGMRTMDGSIFDLLRNGVIDQETALTYCTNPETMRRNIQ